MLVPFPADSVVGSEQVFQRELQDARIARRRETTECPARARRAGSRRRRDRADSFWKVEVRAVEEIEELRPELQPAAFAERNVLDQRKVYEVRPRTFQDVATRRAERAEPLNDECVSVEKSVYSLLPVGQVRIADQIRPAIAKDAKAIVGAVSTEVRSEGLPRLLGDDPSRLPIAEHGVERRVPELEWQVVCEADYQPVADVEARQGAFEGFDVALVEARRNDRVSERVVVYALRECVTAHH